MRREPGAGHALPPSLDRRGGREWSGRRKSRVAYRQCTPWCVFGRSRAGARRLAEQDASHMPRNVTRWVDARKRGSAYNQVACGPSGVSPRRPRLTSSKAATPIQLEITKGYGWQASEPKGDQDVLRVSLERHEDDLLPVAEPPVD